MRKIALFLALATLSCTVIHPRRKPAAHVRHGDGEWWHDRKVIAELALTPAQQIGLDAIGRRAQNDLALLDHEAEISGSFVDAALNADPFDANAYNYVVKDYTATQARLIARDLQRAGEIRTVLSQDQWLALQKELGNDAVELQSFGGDLP